MSLAKITAAVIGAATLLTPFVSLPVAALDETSSCTHCVAQSSPTARYAAIWQQTSHQSAWVARHGMTSSQYQARFDQYVADGYRLVDVSGYSVGNQARYAAIWEKRSGPAWVARHGMTSRQYQNAFDRYVADGYRLVDVSGYSVGNQARYAAIWEKRSGPAWVARHGMTSSQYQARFDQYVADGYRLVHVSGYSVGNQARYAAIWEKRSGPAWVARHGMTSSQYQAKFDELTAEGYRLVNVSGYKVGNRNRYAAIWERQSGAAWVARHGMNSSQYQNRFDQYVADGYRLVNVSGYGQ
ncbi:hypothetical protein [Leptothoe spongobia]|uniref:Uncharacterized protein n=1 Tax=Leptothoe spongobia TAU-MAC 1115 TaxID=1967444 RepID=A0A947DI26_9CYAN|nr:hypothetical protein [Leptothoe spongobia]MBT9317438.1 hypothetical protein [Leptothoe spongobia TAU-MAC 1115]